LVDSTQLTLEQALSFGMSLHILQWILDHGYAVMISGAFAGILLAVHMLVIPFYFFGKRIRVWTSRGALARIHRQSVKNPGETH
jgi:hypothetical protein